MAKFLQITAMRAVRMLEPERAHQVTVRGLRAGGALGLGPRLQGKAGRSGADARLAVSVAGLALPNPVGLAAGFDKNAEVLDAMLRTGFGFVECGTVTPRPQAGNARPRLFRLSEDGAVINRMGFNNAGLEVFAERLARRRGKPGVVGANLGANKDSSDRVGDYVLGLRRLWGLCDYFTVNISSPNTPGLRSLQDDGALDALLGRVAEARAGLDGDAPLFLKVAPDLDADAPARITEQVIAHGFDGIVVSNTTLSREGLASRHREEAGGMSGRPLFARSTEVLKAFARASGGRVPLIGVGGVDGAEAAYAKVRAGASAVQLYSALVYAGPGLVEEILAGLAERLERDGFASLADAVGADL